jgi:voltage-gated potassium channel Kch
VVGTVERPPLQPSSDNLAFLLSAAAWQDSLLQAYRTHLLSSQALLLAFGVAVFAAGFALKAAVAVCVVSILVLAIAFGGSYACTRLQRAIEGRGEDVDFWHEQIILCEAQLPLEEHVFISFKFSQMDKEPAPGLRRDVYPTSKLAAAGLGYTRGVIDLVVARMLLCAWALLALGALGCMAAAIF